MADIIVSLQEDTWADRAPTTPKKKLDIWDHLAMAVGPRPDTVTSDNLRSSRADADVRLFNPGLPVDVETNEPRVAIVPQTTGSNLTPTESYDVRHHVRVPVSAVSVLCAARLTCEDPAARRTYLTLSTSRATRGLCRPWRCPNAKR